MPVRAAGAAIPAQDGDPARAVHGKGGGDVARGVPQPEASVADARVQAVQRRVRAARAAVRLQRDNIRQLADAEREDRVDPSPGGRACFRRVTS